MSKALIWTHLHAQVHRTLRSHQLLPKYQRLLLAVSGGQDSLCLLKLLLDLQPKWGWELGVVYCDHRWRSDSGANGDYIEHLAASWQLSFYRGVATEIPRSEATARQWRYQVLREIAEEQEYPGVVTGHTASDRAETLLYNLMRGSGADGLQALTWKRPLSPTISLVRPLLELTRQQTGDFCQAQQLKIWEDSTNSDLHYARNRIRQELLPYLKEHFNPKVESALSQTAELLQADVEYLEQSAAELFQKALSPDSLKLNRLILRPAPLALQRRVMRRWLLEVLSIAPNFEHIEKLTALISAPNRSQTDPFFKGAIARVEHPWIGFVR